MDKVEQGFRRRLQEHIERNGDLMHKDSKILLHYQVQAHILLFERELTAEKIMNIIAELSQ